MLVQLLLICLLMLSCTLAQPDIYTHNAKKAHDYVVKSLPGLDNIRPSKQPLMYAGQIQQSDNDVSKIFFWLFQQKAKKSDKLVIWLNGGPGCSSMDGALMEVGPLRVSTDGKLEYNEDTWLHDADLLFIDQPKGTGLSTTNGTYVSGLSMLTRLFMTFYGRFLEIFQYYTDKQIYFAGESYAGQLIPYIAYQTYFNNLQIDFYKAKDYALHKLKMAPLSEEEVEISNMTSVLPEKMALKYKVDIKGVLIGNGWISPDLQSMSYVPFALDKGLLETDNDRIPLLFETLSACETAVQLSQQNSNVSVFSHPICTESILTQFLNITKRPTDNGSSYTCFNMYNYNLTSPYPLCGIEWPPDLPQVTSFLRNEKVLESLNVEMPYPVWTECSTNVSNAFVNYNETSSAPLLTALTEFMPVLLFNGNNDIICNHPGIENLTAQMQWQNQTGWSNDTHYRDMVLGSEIFGQVKAERNFTLMEIYNSSHMVPFDHPYASRAIFNYMLGNYRNITNVHSKSTHVEFPDLNVSYDVLNFRPGFVIAACICIVGTWIVVLFMKFTNKSSYLKLDDDE